MREAGILGIEKTPLETPPTQKGDRPQQVVLAGPRHSGAAEDEAGFSNPRQTLCLHGKLPLLRNGFEDKNTRTDRP